MRIVDARSGRDHLKIGDVVTYPDGVRLFHPAFFLQRVGFFPS